MGKFNVVDVNGHHVTVAGKELALTEISVVKLTIYPAEIQAIIRQGNNLVIRLNVVETLTIKGFFTTAGHHSELVLQEGNGALWWLESVGSSDAHFSSIIRIADIPLTSHEMSSTAKIAAWTLGSIAAAGAGLLLAGSSKKEQHPETVTPAADNLLPSEEHSITTIETDRYDNESKILATLGVNVDITPAAATDLTLTDAGGTVINNGSSNDSTPQLQGTAEAAAPSRCMMATPALAAY